MSHDTDAKLIYMAGQIARFMETRPRAEAVAGLAAHINDFWAPPMRQRLAALIDADHPGLHPLVNAARNGLRLPQPA